MNKKTARKPHCISLNEEASRQLAEGAARMYLPKNLYIEKLLREEEARQKQTKTGTFNLEGNDLT